MNEKNSEPTLTSEEISEADLTEESRNSRKEEDWEKSPRQNIEWKETNIEWNESLFTKKDYNIQSTLKREDKDLISTNDFERSKEKSDSYKGENKNIARKFWSYRRGIYKAIVSREVCASLLHRNYSWK